MECFLASNLQKYSHYRKGKMKVSKRKTIVLIFSLFIFASVFFVHPLFSLFGDIYKNYSSMIGQEFIITIPEPVIMLFLGSALIGIGAYTRRRFLNKTP
jgi:hypothetical protein